MNADKRGRPYLYPEPLIAWTACIHISLQTPYRQMEDFVRKLATFIPGLVAADYNHSLSLDPASGSLTQSNNPNSSPET